MPELTVSTVLDAPPEVVWADIEDIASHVEWMHDAVSIEFVTAETAGVGTAFDCATAIGPFRLTDRMEITSWEPNRRMGVRHVGLITGEGNFSLVPVAGGTEFRWTERLSFPWWLAGPLGATIARPVLRRVWRKNLKNLQARFT